MEAILGKGLVFIFMIILGYTLKKIGFFMVDDGKLISKILLNITLPAAVISGFSKFTADNSLVFVVLLGLGCNLIMLMCGFLVSRKKDNSTKAFYMLNFPGYNIGTFTMPFVQNFLGSFGVVVTCMFDTGNAIMCTGGSYQATDSIINAGGKSNLKQMVKKLFSSVPFITYIFMMVITLLGIELPSIIINISSTIAPANAFLAMLFIGIMFEITLEIRYLKQIAFTLFIRYLFGFIFFLLLYFCTPFSLQVKQVLGILVFSPISSLSPLFTEKITGNAALSSLANSLSIVISIVIMTSILFHMKIN